VAKHFDFTFDSGADVNFMNGQFYAKLWTANGSKIEHANVRNCWLELTERTNVLAQRRYN